MSFMVCGIRKDWVLGSFPTSGAVVYIRAPTKWTPKRQTLGTWTILKATVRLQACWLEVEGRRRVAFPWGAKKTRRRSYVYALEAKGGVP